MATGPDPKSDTRLIVSDPSETPATMQVTADVAPLLCNPEQDAQMTSQALHGEHVVLHREHGDFGFVQCLRDRYTGWIPMAALSAPALETTHRVSALRAFSFSKPDLKSAPLCSLSLGAEIAQEEQVDHYLRDSRGGWVTLRHLAPISEHENDPAAVAGRFLHTPYLWGGRESTGLDCSGLTVAAYGACGVLLPRDSDMQFHWCGEEITDWQKPGTLTRNDLVFWKGHVGIMLDDETFLHANAHHMATAKEPLAKAITRIASYYGEPIGARRIDISEGRKTPEWMQT